MKKSVFIAIISVCVSAKAFGQSTVLIRQSLGIEYGYVNIASDDMVGQMMFAKQRVYVYGDEKYSMIRKIATSEEKTLDAIPLEVITELSTGETWFCITIGDQKLRTREGGQSLTQSLGFDGIQDSIYKFSKVSNGIPDIQGYPAENWKFESEEMTPISFYVTTAFSPVELLEKWPFYLKKGADDKGVCLGSDKAFGNTYQMRAVKIDIDQHLDLATEIKGFKPTTNEEINQVMKKYLGF